MSLNVDSCAAYRAKNNARFSLTKYLHYRTPTLANIDAIVQALLAGSDAHIRFEVFASWEHKSIPDYLWKTGEICFGAPVWLAINLDLKNCDVLPFRSSRIAINYCYLD